MVAEAVSTTKWPFLHWSKGRTFKHLRWSRRPGLNIISPDRSWCHFASNAILADCLRDLFPSIESQSLTEELEVGEPPINTSSTTVLPPGHSFDPLVRFILQRIFIEDIFQSSSSDLTYDFSSKHESSSPAVILLSYRLESRKIQGRIGCSTEAN